MYNLGNVCLTPCLISQLNDAWTQPSLADKGRGKYSSVFVLTKVRQMVPTSRFLCACLLGIVVLGCHATVGRFVHTVQIRVVTASDYTPVRDAWVNLNGNRKRTDRRGMVHFGVPDCHLAVVAYKDGYRTHSRRVNYACGPSPYSTQQTIILERR